MAPSAEGAGGQSKDTASDRRLLRCVNCGQRMRSLFVQYSPGNIRLMKCEQCKAIADPYIECEFMGFFIAEHQLFSFYNWLHIILIDLILHKRKAFRHFLFNMLNLDADAKGLLWKSGLLYFILDAYRYSLLKSYKACLDSSRSLVVSIVSCGKVLLDVLFGNFIFVSVLVLGTIFLLNLSFETSRCRQILLAILISSYFRLYLIAMMVWEFPSSVTFIIDMFTLSSNTLALGVVTESSTAGCLGVCFGAYAMKFFYQSLAIASCIRFVP